MSLGARSTLSFVNADPILRTRHKIKNHESNAAQALHGIGAQMRIILSGTPLQNNLMERE